jgi:hypothetical protein
MNAKDLAHQKGNAYALAALKRKRGEMLGEIVRMKRMLAYRQEQLAHIDATITALDPSFRSTRSAQRSPGK